MAITVRELVAIPQLRTTLYAGAAGADRTIAWAHSCELEAPWEWLEANDLLMTNGLGIPTEPEAQEAYIERLARAGVSGIAIGSDLHAPPISERMTAAADRLELPLLLTAYDVPFIALARAVAEANQYDERTRLVKMARIYETVRAAAAAGDGAAELLTKLGAELGCAFEVVDLLTGEDALGTDGQAAAGARAALMSAMAARDGQAPAVLRLDVAGGLALAVPVPSRRATSLLVTDVDDDQPPALALLQHVATIAALEVEKLATEREHRRRTGTELLAHIVDERIDTAHAAARLAEHGFGDEPLAFAALQRPPDEADLHHRLAARGVSHLLLPRDGILLILLPDRPGALDTLLTAIPGDLRVAVRDGLHGPERLPDAAREAQWTLQSAGRGSERVVRYGVDAALFLPRTLSEAREAVAHILGPLLDYDQHEGTELVQTLAVFLRCNRSWQRAAGQLFVHRQTLVYRVRRIEEITGRRLDDTGDVAELWFALRALELTGGSSSPLRSSSGAGDRATPRRSP